MFVEHFFFPSQIVKTSHDIKELEAPWYIHRVPHRLKYKEVVKVNVPEPNAKQAKVIYP